jgi:hypothetical protein
MLTVRFPNGQAVTYNDANFCRYTEHTFNLWTKEGGTWIATITYESGAIIEAVPPCKVENPIAAMTLKVACEMVLASARNANYRESILLADVKKMLRKFHGQRHVWSK